MREMAKRTSSTEVEVEVYRDEDLRWRFVATATDSGLEYQGELDTYDDYAQAMLRASEQFPGAVVTRRPLWWAW